MREIAERTLLIAFVAGALLYAGDYVSLKFKFPGNRAALGSVPVEKSYAVNQKDGKLEYYFDPAEPQQCVHSLFPHFGDPPCWYLSRHPKKRVDM